MTWPDHDIARGWNITADADARQWKAVRHGHLGPLHIAYGCKTVVYAGSLGELEMLLTAEAIKKDMVDVAVRLADRMQEGDRALARELAGGAAGGQGPSSGSPVYRPLPRPLTTWARR